jgi:hypothetical protein
MGRRSGQRAFLRSSAATAVGVPLLLREIGQTRQAIAAPALANDADVIVVGAGMAGISGRATCGRPGSA